MLDIIGKINRVLGKGNFWLVKEVQLDNPISVNGKLYTNVACKFSIKNSQEDIDRNLNIYQSLKKSNVPTLEFMDKGCFESEICLIAENLADRDDVLFVSPNTLRNKPNPLLIALLHKKNDYVPSKIETYLSNSKVNEIVNFNDFLNCSEKQVRLLSKKSLGLCEDALFFGVDKKTRSKLTDWLIADFDCIEIDYFDDEGDVDPFNGNMQVFLNALYEFVFFFVAEKNQAKYLDIISEWHEKYQTNLS